MRKMVFLLLLATLSFGRTVANNVHPGLKSAIDRGDIQTAVNLRASGAPGIYCPAELSPGNAVKLYRNELRNDPKQIIDNCSPEFIEKISAKSCANPNNIKLCKSILMKTKVTKWQPMLDKIIENEVYKSEPFFEQEMDRGFKSVEELIDYSPLNWSSNLQKLVESMMLIAKIDETNRKEKSRSNYNFRSNGFEEKSSISSRCYADLTCSVDKLVEKYMENPYLDYKTMVLFCRLQPDIDKAIQKSKGLNIFDCAQVLNEYNELCAQDRFVEKTAYLNASNTVRYKCHKGLWSKASETDLDIGINECSPQNNGAFLTGSVDNRNKYVCVDSSWIPYSRRIGNVEVSSRNLDVGGKTFTYDNMYFREKNQTKAWKRYSQNWGHIYGKSDLNNVCPDGWRLPNESDLKEIKQQVDSKQVVFPYIDYSYEDPTGNDGAGCRDMYENRVQRDTSLCEMAGSRTYWTNNTKIYPEGERSGYSYIHPNVYWAMGKNGKAFVYGVDKFGGDRYFTSDWNFIRCVRDTSTAAFLAASKKRKETPKVSDESQEYGDDGRELSERKKRLRSRGKKNNRDDDGEDDSYEDAGHKDPDAEEENKEKENKGDFFADDLHVGMHLGIGYAGVWGSELAHGIYLTNGTLEEGDKDPYAGTFGIMGDIGIVINYHLGSLFSVVPEVNVRIINYSKESEIWKLRVIDEYGNFKEMAPLNENMMIVDVNVPLILRVTPTPSFFIDLGADLNMNVSSKFTLSNSDYDYEEDMGGYWATEQFKWGGVFGLGTTLSISESLYLDVGGRLVVDMSRIEKNQLVDMIALNGTYRNPVGAKTWGIELVINGYMF